MVFFTQEGMTVKCHWWELQITDNKPLFYLLDFIHKDYTSGLIQLILTNPSGIKDINFILLGYLAIVYAPNIWGADYSAVLSFIDDWTCDISKTNFIFLKCIPVHWIVTCYGPLPYVPTSYHFPWTWLYSVCRDKTDEFWRSVFWDCRICWRLFHISCIATLCWDEQIPGVSSMNSHSWILYCRGCRHCQSNDHGGTDAKQAALWTENLLRIWNTEFLCTFLLDQGKAEKKYVIYINYPTINIFKFVEVTCQ